MIEAVSKSNDEIFNILFNTDEITWQSMIYELVKSEKMDPWDIDVSLLSQKFLDRLRKLKEMDLKISGKVLLAASILLRVKSYRFMEEDINALDALIASANSREEEQLYEELFDIGDSHGYDNLEDRHEIFPRTPQPRKRKVSVFDLVNALEKALEVYQRRPPKPASVQKMVIPEKPRDISLVIRDVYSRIINFFSQNNKKAPKLTLNLLLPSHTKEDTIFTFIPLLHLDHQRKVDLMQEQHFGEIEIKLLEKQEIL